MSSDDQDQKQIKNLTAMALNEAMKKGPPKESPGLDKRFRCPNDGSTNTQAVQEILDASSTSIEINGKSVSATVDSPLLRKYRIGPRPRVRYEFIPLSVFFFLLVFAAFGMWGGALAVLQAVVMLASSAFTFMIFWQSKTQLPAEVAKQAERKYTAENMWHCHQCGKPFLPKPPLKEVDPSDSQEPAPEQCQELSPTAENVSPLVPGSLSAEDVQH